MNPANPNNYCGRFAPSPTGPLHLGSLVAAVGSYLQAKSRQGQWLVRIEDLDPPREIPGAADAILRTLERYGLYWDKTVTYQSQRHNAYAAALDELTRQGVLYPCDCSRKEVAATGRAGPYGMIYSGRCRAHHKAGTTSRSALRVRVHDQPIVFEDALRGRVSQQLAQEVGDFVVRRADGLFAYQLAVVVDDAAQGITEVVRGSDLLDNTPRQIHLQQLLKYPTPRYCHLPLVLNTKGEKLSKQSGAKSIENHPPQTLILEILNLLNQTPPTALKEASLDELWQWAIRRWQLASVPRTNLTGPR